MVDKELRKLNRRELLQILLIQCEEAEKIQKETDAMKEELDTMRESYERLKKKLDIKDERLNQKDAKIAELNREIEELKEAGNMEKNEIGVVTEALSQLNEVFEGIQKSVEQYVEKEKKDDMKQSLADMGSAADARKKQSPSRGQIISVNFGKTVSDRRQKGDSMTEAAKASGAIYG